MWNHHPSLAAQGEQRRFSYFNIERNNSAADAGLENASITEKRLYVAHRKLERNPKAAKAAKGVHGYVCQSCSFDFGAIYGEAAQGYIEAHHLIPLSEIPEGHSVELDPEKDFAVLLR